MKRVIVVRVCEIFLKGKNRYFFLSLLEKHIQNSLCDIPHKFIKMQMRYLIEKYDPCDERKIMEKLLKISGIHTLSAAYSVESQYESIRECALVLCEGKTGTFKVETNRADKTFPMQSVELSRELGGEILSVYGGKLSVDVKEPSFVLRVDIRENGVTLLYTDSVKGVGGMPVGSSGHGFLMLSGGIDSPVAGYMMAKRGMKLSCVHFHSYPYTGEAAKEKVIKLAGIVAEYAGPMDLYIVRFTHIQEAIHEKCDEELMITLMRRFMMRITERLAKKYGGQAIVTGESLGQVASQTMESISSSDSVVGIPVFRPLIAFDKLDTIAIANKIDTYETSILPYEDCCTVFLPKFPAIRPKLERILREENRLDIENLIEEALKDVEIVSV